MTQHRSLGRRTGHRVSLRRFALALLVGGGAALRWFRLGEESLWVDEVYAVVSRAGGSLGEVLAAVDPHPPLYYLLLHGWLGVFGGSPTAARSLSVVVGVATVVVVYALGRDLYDRSAGLLAAALLAVSPIHVQYSRSARMYALLVLLACLSTYAYLRIHRTDGGWRWVAGYAAATLALLNTHAFAVFVVAAHATHLAGLAASENRRVPAPNRLLPAGVVVVVGYLPWVLGNLDYLDPRGGPGPTGWISPPSVRSVVRTFDMLGGSLAGYPYATFDPVGRAVGRVAVVLVLACVLLYLYRRDGDRGAGARLPDERRLLGAWIALPIVGPLALSYLVSPVYVSRYAVAAVVPIYLAAAVGIRSVQNPGGRAVVAGVLVACLVVSTGIYHGTGTQEPWNEVSEYLDGRVDPDESVSVAPEWAATSLSYYADASVVGVPFADGTGGATPLAWEGVPDPDGAVHWLVVREPAPRIVVGDRVAEGYVVVDERRFGTLRVLRLSATGDGR